MIETAANNLYPLKFTPIFREKLWGGQKIKNVLGMDTGNLNNCGEAWILSGEFFHPSVIANGFFANYTIQQLIDEYKELVVGKKIYEHFNGRFPLLIKFIDATEDLSIQVHPDDDYCEKHFNCKNNPCLKNKFSLS